MAPDNPASNEQTKADQPTHVVTCFLLRTTDGQDEVFLVRRSEHVRTYQGAWAAISGYLETADPLDQAYTELREEAALDRSDVRLVRSGEPVAFRDTAIGQSWVVHPFLFALRDGAALRTDWEASDSRWVAPDAVAALPSVPLLANALARVYPIRGGGTGA